MRVLSFRIDDDAYGLVEQARIEAGLSRTEWLRSTIATAVAHRPPPPAPESVAVQWCSHPPTKRLGSMCVACGHTLSV